MKTTKSGKINVRQLTYMALFTAIVFVLQIISFFTRGPVFSLTFVLVPIVIAVAVCGIKAGPWLGFVFGVAVLVTGDATAFLAIDPVATVAVVLVKGTLAGLAAALVYKALEAKNKYLAVTMAAVTAPIVNSGIFFLGSVTFFWDTMVEWSGGTDVLVYILTVLIGLNFIIEVAVNLILVPTVYRIVEMSKKKIK
ncbi:MAG: ECF transporter S component [Clostridia bacterium]|nr:ECF transporter S component [Clostridia bacterium]